MSQEKKLSLLKRSIDKLPKEEKQSLLGAINIQGPLRRVPDADFIQGNDFGITQGVPSPYATHSWVYGSVRAISQNIAGVPLKVETGALDAKVEIGVEDKGVGGDLARVLDHPNPHMSGNDLWEATSVNINLSGCTFWVLERSSITEVPKSIMPFSKDFFEPSMDNESGIQLGWWFVNPFTGQRIPLRHDQVLVYRFYNPYDPIFGLSPLEAASRGLVLDLLANSYSQGFFENNGEPGGIIQYDKRLSKKQADDIVEQWEQRHRGPFNARKVAILYGGGKFVNPAPTQRDMEFIKQREWTRDEILAVFKVPETEISMYQNVSRSNAQSQDRAFWVKTLIPIIRNFESVLRTQLIPGLRPSIGAGLSVTFSIDIIEALQEILTEKITNAVKLSQIGYPINAINDRLRLGMPKMEWGDMWYPNRSVAPIDQIVSGEATGSKPSGPSDTNNPGGRDDTDLEDEDTDREDQEEDNSIDLYSMTDHFKSLEHDLAKVLRTYFYKLRSHQLKRVDKCDGAFTEVLFDEDQWNTKLETRVVEVYVSIVNKLCELSGITVEVKDPAYRMRKFVARVRDVVNQAVTSHDDKQKAMASIRQVFNGVSNDKTLSKLCHVETIMTIAKAYSVWKRSHKNAS
jgi:HK97 family phage portal protein